MSERSLAEQLTKYLTDAHSIEVQAVAQLQVAPRLAGDGQLGRIFREHLREPQEHARLVREQLERGGENRRWRRMSPAA